jgi:predicted O-methyltransferase YrrM
VSITTTSFEKQYIREQARRIRAANILEVGAFKGQTTAVLSDVAAENGGRVYVVDPMQWASKPAHILEWIFGLLHPFSYEKIFWRNVNRTGHKNVVLHRALSTDATLIARSDPELQQFDLVFIDGEHTYEGALADVLNWGSRVRQGGLILMHDAIERFPGVVRVIRELETERNYRVHWPVRGSVAVIEVVEAVRRNRTAA